MSEAILTRAGNAIDSSALAVIEVTLSGKVTTATVTCTNGIKSYTKSGNGLVSFNIRSFGNWTVTAQFTDGKAFSKIVKVDQYQIYRIMLGGRTFGITINMDNSSPNGTVSYTDDAVGFNPLYVSNGICNYGSWGDIIVDGFGCKPCLYNNNQRSVYLNPNNYGLSASGESVDIVSGNVGDVMVEFKRTWYKFEMNGNNLTFKVADFDRSDEGFISDAFYAMDGSGVIKDYMYYSAFEGYYSGGRIRSLSGKEATRNYTIGNFRNFCKANGSTYGLEDWAKRCYILGLSMLVTKGRGIQAVVGNGICDNKPAIKTGTMNTNGLFYGGDSSVGCKLFGIEQFYGNWWKWCDGLVTTGTSGTIKMKNRAPYTDNGADYTVVSGVMPHGSSGCPTQMKPFFNGAMIFPSMIQSDYSKGWQDRAYVGSDAACVARVGGYYNDLADDAGPFCVLVNSSASSASSSCLPVMGAPRRSISIR